MKKNILITDTLFIFPEHEAILEANDFVIERIDKPSATEDELVAAIKGKHGYVLGGIESVTPRVIEAADVLEAISFTGSGYTEFIPAHKEATEKGIAISAAKGGNAVAVAEFTLMLILMMVRRLPLLTATGGTTFYVAPGLSDITLGIVGFGHIGKKVAGLARLLGMKVVVNSRNREAVESNSLSFVELDDLLTVADVVTLHVDKEHGANLVGKTELQRMRDGAILINVAFPEAVDQRALHDELIHKRLFAAFDAPAGGDYSDVQSGYYLCSNSQTAFNTREANKEISDRVTRSIMNLLSTGTDTDLVNPEFSRFRR